MLGAAEIALLEEARRSRLEELLLIRRAQAAVRAAEAAVAAVRGLLGNGATASFREARQRAPTRLRAPPAPRAPGRVCQGSGERETACGWQAEGLDLWPTAPAARGNLRDLRREHYFSNNSKHRDGDLCLQ
jgi:hypothetical protein